MTNRELVIKALQGELDDYGLDEESIIEESIDCPYMHTAGHPCDCNGFKDSQCLGCKLEWLDKEVAQ
jgi:hypothetical protein